MTTAGSLVPAMLQCEPAAVLRSAGRRAGHGHSPFIQQPNQWLETITALLSKQNDAH
jgi:hypothetical protein